jgi:hypothetical protein
VRFGGTVSFGRLSGGFGERGVIGDPMAATVERGADLFGGGEACRDGPAEVARFEFTAP